ncbi:hypothetical protein DaAHT2_1838 [Desulfurivibrio alkaliphilus AHT 2]|uniref:NAD-dependent epimerase/dehydratase family protein n=1 Tax=Desulfurivibrio alkaliphilus (strain DSM 19089 / UNIQEM U267 / AHT2) TaxID=589865 RepID=D6Z4P4_DESAT|nr:hypothetical protein [Desulfurivibrio alkaliphilus]ADH86519.1 hypothetical protein DaAHT2_1838 [Desulfurivibrio alkaliphilus AHT 2]
MRPCPFGKPFIFKVSNFSTGFRDSVVSGSLAVAELDVADANVLSALFSRHRFDAVLHFASFIQVDESVTDLQVLGWQPCYAELETIVEHAWAWAQKWPWSTGGTVVPLIHGKKS